MTHEAPLELLRRNPQLAAVLLRGLGIAVPPEATATVSSSDQTASVPIEFRSDAVILLSGRDDARLAVIVEVQLRYDADKYYSWPAYVTQVRAAHHCPAVLLVICRNPRTARRCRTPISTGHPGFDLSPVVVDSVTMPDPVQGTTAGGPELMVLAALIGALDLAQDQSRRLLLSSLAGIDKNRLKTYTVYILDAAAPAARQALEALMTTTPFRNDFVDRLLAEGKAEGLAQMILRVLAARGLEVSAETRRRVLSCTDTGQLEAWGDRAATAATVQEVFGS
jgi:hypothetical protein